MRSLGGWHERVTVIRRADSGDNVIDRLTQLVTATYLEIPARGSALRELGRDWRPCLYAVRVRRVQRAGGASARLLRVVVAGLMLAALVGCGPTFTVPDVVGMRLDAAHRVFEGMEVDEFEDVDVVGDEDTIMWDSNWVVVAQDPPAGATDVDKGETIRLEVGNEDDSEVLELIPADSPFAQEMAPDPEPEAEAEPSASNSPTEEPSTPAPPSPSVSESLSAEDMEAVACQRRKGNPGEIYVWNSYGNDQSPDAIRLGAGYVWDFGDRICITSTQFALDSNPGLPGYCTEVGKVANNPGYRVNERPAARIPNILGQAGDC